MIENRYEENKARLQRGIREGKISLLEIDSKDHACYFCKKHIEGKMFVLILDEQNGLSKFYVDERCYKRAQLFPDYRGMPVSLN